VRMPNLRLTESNAADLISYIGAQTANLTDGTQGTPAANHQHHQH